MTIDRNPHMRGLHAFVFIDHSEEQVSTVIGDLALHEEGFAAGSLGGVGHR